MMGIKDAADYLEVHQSTIYRLVGNGQIPAFKLGGQWRFKRDILDEWLTAEMQKNSANNYTLKRK
ncbi:MAG: helix-turn-helix domain-containing protein [Candidatus Omnitrophica bacterium]|nr:helix-turn-helix domain-containing protein [Candidatus Omnitrophota bacterium]